MANSSNNLKSQANYSSYKSRNNCWLSWKGKGGVKRAAATDSPATITQSSNDDNGKFFSQMTPDELHPKMHAIITSMFGFAGLLACTINGGRTAKELEKYIINESINGSTC